MRRIVCSAVAVVLALASCVAVLKRDLKPPERVLTTDHRSPFLKAHLRDGRLLVLQRWSLDPAPVPAARPSTMQVGRPIPTAGIALVGDGKMLDPARALVREGPVRVPLDSVALFETNVVVHQIPPLIKALALSLGVVVTVIAISCAIDPKACFGSCPTFYVNDGAQPLLQAEGFSASVMPALEATDVDALYRANLTGKDVTVTMRNEALETHVVRHVRLLAARRAPGTRVFATSDGAFWQASTLTPASRAIASEGNCEAALRELDGEERFSRTDSTDLATRETIDLRFPASPGGAHGLVLGGRQTLLTTFLFYNTLADLGPSAGEWIARVERGGAGERNAVGGMGRLLGGIEVLVRDAGGGWTAVDTVGETGPLAADVWMVPLPRAGNGPLEVRLRLVRGMWRLDWATLATLDRQVEPVRLDPTRVMRDGRPDPEALASLADPARALVTTRGEQVQLVYRLPEDANRCELFLESRGYYLEWMRKEWLEQENPARAMRAFLDPAGTLRELAPEFKHREAVMEGLFWGSRYAFP